MATSDILKDVIMSGITGAADSYLDSTVNWAFGTLYGGFNSFLNSFNQDVITLFSLNWVQAIVLFIQYFGIALFAIGFFVAIADCAIEYQNERGGSIQNTALNIFKGFFAASLFTTLPIELYKFCVYSQETLGNGIGQVFAQSMGYGASDLAGMIAFSFETISKGTSSANVVIVLEMIAFVFCVVKIFFASIKRGGILLTQIAIGSLYMFSIPRGYQDAFWNWCKQVIGTCFTAFMQTTLLYLGCLTVGVNIIVGLGVILAAAEIPRIAQQFGMDTSIKGNMTSAVFAANSAVNLVRTIKTM